MKVHISLDLDRVPDEESRDKAVAELEGAFKMRNINRKRAQRYGVVTAEVDPGDIKGIAAHDAVKSCECDEEQRAPDKDR